MNAHDFEQLLNWIEGRLSDEEAQEVETRLKIADNETQSLVKWLQEFRHLNQNYLLAAPPDDLDKTLYDIFTKKAKTKRQPRFFQRLLASLTFDSYQQLALAGVRSASAQKSERQFVYSADLADITLDLQWLAPEKQIRLNGQLFPADEKDETIYLVEVQKESKSLATTQTDALGRFTFPALLPDTYNIIFSGAQSEIALSDVELSI
jgi:hypothetical protein